MSGEVDNEIRRGTVDLLYRRKGAWTIVDFKSDRVETAAGNLEEALPAGHPYREQVRAYRAAWADVHGRAGRKRRALVYRQSEFRPRRRRGGTP
jgi:ATP-dependent exoDNAse (exonuclease V) beta subunit